MNQPVKLNNIFRISLSIFFLVFVTSSSQSQLIPLEDKAKIDSTLQSIPERIPFKSLEEGRKLLDLSRRINYKTGEAKILLKLAQTYTKKHQEKKAIEAITQAKSIFFQHGTETDRLEVLYEFANIYRFFDNLKEAMDLSNQTIGLANQLDDSLVMAKAMWNLAMVHLKIGQRENFFELGRKVLSLYETRNDIEGVIGTYMYFGNISIGPDSTLYYLDKVKSLLPKVKDTVSRENFIFDMNTILTRILVGKARYVEGEIAANKALEIARKKGNVEAIAIQQYYLSEIQYYYYKNYEKAIALADSSLQYEKSIGRYYYVIPEAQYLAGIYEANNQPEKALELARLAMVYQDSLYWANRKNDAADIEKEYELERQQSEIKLLENQRRIRTILGVAITSILLLLVGFFYRQHQLKSKHLRIQEQLSEQLRQDKQIIEQQKKELESINATKDRLFAIIGHDLRGPLFSLQGLEGKINYLLKTGQSEKLKNLGGRMDNAAKYLTNTLNNLLQWSMQQMEKLPYAPEQFLLSESINESILLFENQIESKQISLQINVPPKHTVYMDKVALNTILRNLISNALKFSHPQNIVKIFSKSEEEKIILTIQDAGIGMSEEQLKRIENEVIRIGNEGTKGEKSTGLGWSLIKGLIHQNKGTFKIKSKIKEGTIVEICLPKDPLLN